MPDFLTFVVNALGETAPRTTRWWALTSFTKAVRHNDVHSFSDEALRLWMADSLLSGTKLATARRYLGILHTLYKSWPGANAAEADPFAAVLNATASWTDIDLSNVSNNRRILLQLVKQNADSAAADLFFFLLYNPAMPLNQALTLKFNHYEPGSPQTLEIIRRRRTGRPTAQYIFPLEQSQKRLPQLQKEAMAQMEKFLRHAGMRFAAFSRDDITALWIATAAECGIKAGDIRSIISALPAEYAFLSLVPTNNAAATEEILDSVANAINDRTLRWFVAKLRNGVAPHDIERHIRSTAPALTENLTFYYPCRRTLRMVKNKRVATDTPYLPGLLFIRTYRDTICHIMRHAGHMAWCFKIANTPDSPYTTISVREMTRFQRHIGKFTPDIEMQLIDTSDATATVGDSVNIIGGDLYEGHSGQVIKAVRRDGRITYTLRLTESKYIRWEAVDIDSIFIQHAQAKA